MKIETLSFIAVAALASAQAETPRFQFRAVVQPGTTIAGRTFTPASAIGAAAVNDAGEVAFIVSEAGVPPTLFTSRRIVARQGDLVGGKFIVLLPHDGILAINNAGQVAYEAWYADSRELATAGDASGRGIFVDDHLASDEVFDAHGNAALFILTEDGRIALERPGPVRVPANPGVTGRIRIRPPKDSPVSITPIPIRPNRPAPRAP